jgi:hypothetical protein
VTPGQARRLCEMRSRVLVRSFEYRQRNHARGAWFRLRCVLALAAQAYAISRGQAEELVQEGFRPEPAGRELEPSRVIVFVPGERAARIAAARPLAVRLSAELLAAEGLALVSFSDRPVAG